MRLCELFPGSINVLQALHDIRKYPTFFDKLHLSTSHSRRCGIHISIMCAGRGAKEITTTFSDQHINSMTIKIPT
jgi:hypothetical protein